MSRRLIPWKTSPTRATGAIHLTATLRGIKPRIWRSFVVPERLTLARLHRVLQELFDWEDQHLHFFQFGNLAFAPAPPKGEEYDDIERLGADYKGIVLSQFALELGDHFSYTYDMGDEWIVDLAVDASQEGLIPTWCWCTSGERASPPENCGGPLFYSAYAPYLPGGYDPDDRESMEAFPPGFDPAAFDIDALNRRLARLR